MASSLQWMPDSLYNSAISVVADNYCSFERELKTFTASIVFDIYYKLYKAGKMEQLNKELENLVQIEKVLKVNDKRYLLHNCFQALMDQGYKTALELANAFEKRSRESPKVNPDDLVEFGFSLAMFLSDAGWFPESEIILQECLQVCLGQLYSDKTTLVLECYRWLLRVQNCCGKIKEAKKTFNNAEAVIANCKSFAEPVKINYAGIYSEFSNFYFTQSNYNKAYEWSCKALAELNSSLSFREAIHILCTATKACTSKKEFSQADLLIKQAIQRASEKYGNRSLFMAEVLLDYGNYLLHSDRSSHAVRVYKRALKIRINVLGGKNLLIAIAHEDLAYATYVSEYSTGLFNDARDHVEKALSVKHSLLPEDSFLLPSAKRVYALILEEIAIDIHEQDVQQRLFGEAEDLHMSALKITHDCLGELTVLTGKHYGNLGRLYQSMKKFEKARKMHTRAIAIKREILGSNDYEVAISLGHLASLYNYDLKLYDEAEALYVKAIEIGKRQFGRNYSGLEYDYRGLLRVYSQTGQPEKVTRLYADLGDWKLLRDQTLEAARNTSPLMILLPRIATEEIHPIFLTLSQAALVNRTV